MSSLHIPTEGRPRILDFFSFLKNFYNFHWEFLYISTGSVPLRNSPEIALGISTETSLHITTGVSLVLLGLFDFFLVEIVACSCFLEFRQYFKEFLQIHLDILHIHQKV